MPRQDTLEPPRPYDAVDLCAGPGGWDVAAQWLGLDVLGFEIDDAAILTREAAGHHTVTVPCDAACRAGFDKPKAHDRAHPRGVRGLSMTEVDPLDYLAAWDRLAVEAVTGQGQWRGLIASPPCQGFSMAGKGQARVDCERLLREVYACRTAADVEAAIAGAAGWMSHEGTALVLEPLRWALTSLPDWCAWEQVPAVLPVWHACAHVLRMRGYTVEAAILSSEQYGVAQTRERAVLVARSAAMTAVLGPAQLPTPTHSRYHRTDPTRLDAGVPRWVSMADALGGGMTARPAMTVTGGGTEAGGAEPFGSAARQGMERERAEGRRLRMGNTTGATVRPTTDPAPTVLFGHRSSSVEWYDNPPPTRDEREAVRLAGGGSTSEETSGQRPRDLGEPAHTVTGKGTAAWVVRTGQNSATDREGGSKPYERDLDAPSPTITGQTRSWKVGERVNNQSGTDYDIEAQLEAPASVVATRDLVPFRGANANRFNDSTKSRNDGIRVTVDEASALQSFPYAYPWRGTKTKRFQQVGNAVPPLLAFHVLRSAACDDTRGTVVNGALF